MDRRSLYASDLQIDYFSESYSHFEEDFQRYSNMSVPLTFLTDDILRTMALCHTNYFRLNQENAKDGRNHYFVFKVKQRQEMKNHYSPPIVLIRLPKKRSKSAFFLLY